ncbi:MAG: PatB family C-S lyase [Sterolibacterium sp.]|nr:PatB family C-S lyase [Sterolibacterium sp.]
MSLDFDRIIERCGSDSIKWGKYAGRDPGIIPLWVADMDFAAPPAVLNALRRRIEHGVFGYGGPWSSLIEALQNHLASEYQWQVDEDWLVWLPGLVTGLNVACRAVGGPQDEVFTATPIYPPFLSAPQFSQRGIVSTALTCDNGRWEWDYAAVEAALTPATKLFLLCHPHNPVGRVWREHELREIAELAERHDLIVCSDEIHCGLILDPQLRHQPFATLSAAAARRSITLMAPSKTFNIPGLGCAFAVIPDAALRRAFRTAMQGIVPHVNVLGLAATEAAYRHAGAWHAALLDYLRGNRDRVEEQIARMPGLSMTHVEATYLAWIDARRLCRTRGIDNPQRFFEEAGVGLSDGADFSRSARDQRSDTSGFVRLNFGCPRALLDTALRRMHAAVAG